MGVNSAMKLQVPPQAIEEQAEKGEILELYLHYGVVWRALITVTWIVCPCAMHFVGQSVFIYTDSREFVWNIVIQKNSEQ